MKYYPLGDDVYPVMLEALEKAEKFIFMEYFIIRKGQLWQSFLDILERKAREGVDVRVVYDDLGSLAMLPKNYPKELEARGIKCFAFNRLGPVKGVMMNNRDHRKMTILDGHTVFSGGINLADEYINVDSPYGHWKDNGIMIKGPAVWSYTVMFLTMWNAFRQDNADFTAFRNDFGDIPASSEGLVVPYGDSPLDDEFVGENVYLNIINQAKRYGVNRENAREKLLEAPWETLMEHQGVLFEGPSLQNLGPVFDGVNFDGNDALEIIHSGKANYVTILGGYNRDEYSSLMAYYPMKSVDDLVGFFGRNTPYIMSVLEKYHIEGDMKRLVDIVSRYFYGFPCIDMFDAFAEADKGNVMYLQLHHHVAVTTVTTVTTYTIPR